MSYDDLIKTLRVGNLVFKGTRLVRVCSIMEHDKRIDVEPVLILKNPSHAGCATLSSCTFIPITKDWLKKLGWQYLQGRTDGDLTRDAWKAKLEIDFIDGVIQIKSRYAEVETYQKLDHIKYVHQLQNLYYFLTGEELEVKE